MPRSDLGESTELTVRVGGRDKALPIAVDAPDGEGAAGNPATLGVAVLHGAGGDLGRPAHLAAAAAACAALGLPALRWTCRGPLPHRAAACAAVLAAAPVQLPPFARVSRWVLVGHSMGGRVAAAVAAAAPARVAGLALLSFPLHPPGRAGDAAEACARRADLVACRAPLLLVRGTADPFSGEARFAELLGALRGAPAAVHAVGSGDHALAVRGPGAAAALDAALAAVRDFVRGVAAAAPPPAPAAAKRRRGVGGQAGGGAAQEPAAQPAVKRRRR